MRKAVIAWLILLTGTVNGKTTKEPSKLSGCTDQKFVSAFADNQFCLLASDVFSCTRTYALIGALAGVAISTAGNISNAASKARPLPLTGNQIESYFKQQSSLKLEQQAQQASKLSEATIDTLKAKGFNTAEVEEVEKILEEFRKKVEDSNKIHESEIQKTKTAREQIQKNLVNLNNQLKANPSNRSLRQQVIDQNALLKELERQTLALQQTHKKNIHNAQKQTASQFSRLQPNLQTQFRGQFLNTFRNAGISGVAVALVPVIRDEFTLTACASKIGFQSSNDEKLFLQYGAVVDRTCETEIKSSQVINLLLLSAEERNKIFTQSPSLCRAFEKSFTYRVNAMAKRFPKINFGGTRCEDKKIETEVLINGRIYQQSLQINNNNIIFNGSFIQGAHLEKLTNNEKFAIQMKKDLTWSGLFTENPVWAGTPGAIASFSNLGNSSNPDNFREFANCQVLSNIKKFDRQMVTNTNSGGKLICAAYEQAMAAKIAIPQLLSYCHSKSKLRNFKKTDTKINDRAIK